MKKSTSESDEKNIDLSAQPKNILTANLPDPHLQSFSDIIDNSDEESPTDVKTFFLDNRPLPKFIENIAPRPGYNDPSNVSASSDSEEYNGSHHSKKASIKSKRLSVMENMRFDSKNSIKYSTITFNEGFPSLKKVTSTFGFEGRENSPLVLSKFPSNPSFNQSFEMSTSAKGGSNNNKVVSIMIPDQTAKKRFVKHIADHNEDGQQPSNPTEINIKSSTLGDIDPAKLVGRSSNLIMTQAFIRAAFRQAIEKNKDLDPTKRELDLLKDRSYVPNIEDSKSKKANKAKRRLLPNLKKILQKNGILSKNIKISEVKRILKELSKTRTLTQNIKRQWKIMKIVMKRRLRFLNVIHRFFVHWRIHPMGYFRLSWDFFSTFLIFYDLLVIPFQMGFDVAVDSGFMLYFERMEDIFFMIDLVINFLTGYYDGQLLVMSGRKIVKRYLKSWFIVDLTAAMTGSLIIDNAFNPDDNSGSSSSSGNAFRLLKFLRFIRFMRVLRALRLKRIFNRMEEFFYSNVYLSIKGLIILFFYIAFLAHLSACLWHFVGISFADDDITTIDTWLSLFGYNQLPMADQYVVSLYWAITTMLTVGYGDIVPVNATERIINIVVMLLGCGVFGYSMNKIGELVQNINRDAAQTRQIYHNINKYMEKMDVTKSLRTKVIQYLDYMNENQRHGKLAEEQVFSVLSESLREEIRKDINGKVLRENTLFQQNFDSRFLSLLSYKLEERTFSPGQIIFDEFDKSCSLYLMSKGTIELFISKCDTVINRLEGDNHFGELSFFTGKPRTASARSTTFSHIFFITKQDFLTLIEDHPREKEVYHYIKDQLNLYSDYSILGAKCIICGDPNHDARGCYRIHYVPDRKIVLQKHTKESKIFSNTFKRKPRKKFSALPNQSEVAYLAGVFVDEHPHEINKVAAVESVKQKPRQKEAEQIAAMNKLSKYTSNAGAANPVIPEENSRAEQSPRRSSGGKQNKPFINLRAAGARNSFATDEEDRDSDKFMSPKHPPKHKNSILGFASPELQLREFFARRGSSPTNTMKLPYYGFDNQNPASLIDEQMIRAALEGSYLMSELQSQNVVFDMVCNYAVYFPHNNIRNILGESELKSPMLEAEKSSPSQIKRASVSYADMSLRFGRSFDSPITPIALKAKGAHNQKAKSEKSLLVQLKKGKNLSEVFKK